MKLRIRFVVVSALVLFTGAAAIFYFSVWFDNKQERVLSGLADPHFPYPDYTVEELERLYPQNPNENVVTTQTPEETHVKFIAALKAGDIDGAVECCVVPAERQFMRQRLLDINKNQKIGLMIDDIENIEAKMSLSATASYTYQVTSKGEKMSNMMTFNKNSQGIWLIESF